MSRSSILTTFGVSAIIAAAAVGSREAHSADKICKDLASCVEYSGKLTGQKYTYNRLLDGRSISLSANTEMTKENAELIITNMLHMNELTRVPSGEPNSFYIIESKHAIQSPVPTFEASLTVDPKLPNTYDVVTVKYKTVDAKFAEEIQRFLTDLVPRNGRVTSYPDSNVLLITDSAMNIRKIIDVLRSVDKPLSVGYQKELKERAARVRARSKDIPPPKPNNG